MTSKGPRLLFALTCLATSLLASSYATCCFSRDKKEWQRYGVSEGEWTDAVIREEQMLSDGLKVKLDDEEGYIEEKSEDNNDREFLFVSAKGGLFEPVTNSILGGNRLRHSMKATRRSSYHLMGLRHGGQYLQSGVSPMMSAEDWASAPCVMLLGKTGAGKSTLASVLQLDDHTLLQTGGDSPDFPASGELVSMTKQATVKRAYWRGQVSPSAQSVLLIDTPGFGDTTGDGSSQHLFEKTVAKLKDMEDRNAGMGGVSAFVLVVKVGDRWDDRMDDMIRQCAQTFTNGQDSIWDRLHVVLTHWEETSEELATEADRIFDSYEAWALVSTGSPEPADGVLTAEDRSELDELLSQARRQKCSADDLSEPEMEAVFRDFAASRKRADLIDNIVDRFERTGLLNENDGRLQNMRAEHRFYFCSPNSCGTSKRGGGHRNPAAVQAVTSEMYRLLASVKQIQRESNKFVCRQVEAAANARTRERNAVQRLNELAEQERLALAEQVENGHQSETRLKEVDTTMEALDLSSCWAGLGLRRPFDHMAGAMWGEEAEGRYGPGESEYFRRYRRRYTQLPEEQKSIQRARSETTRTLRQRLSDLAPRLGHARQELEQCQSDRRQFMAAPIR